MDATDGPLGPAKGFAAADLDLVERYVAGELPPAEAAAFAQQLSSDPERAALVRTLTAIWNGEDPRTPSFDVHALWARALPRVRERRHTSAFIDTTRHQSFLFMRGGLPPAC